MIDHAHRIIQIRFVFTFQLVIGKHQIYFEGKCNILKIFLHFLWKHEPYIHSLELVYFNNFFHPAPAGHHWPSACYKDVRHRRQYKLNTLHIADKTTSFYRGNMQAHVETFHFTQLCFNAKHKIENCTFQWPSMDNLQFRFDIWYPEYF